MLDTETYLKTLAAKWCAKFPDHVDRINRGLEYALSNKVAPRSCQSWRVAGSKGAEYTVEVNCGFPSCTCPDFTNSSPENRQRCKHVWSAALMTRLAAQLEAEIQKVSTPKPPSIKADQHRLAQHLRRQARHI